MFRGIMGSRQDQFSLVWELQQTQADTQTD